MGTKAKAGSAAPSQIAPSEIRKELIQTYMYFLSAPFLAVAVYYLLQIVASSVAEPVLVVIAFASGLMSNTAVGAIMAFADKFLEERQRGEQPNSTANASEDDSSALPSPPEVDG